MKLDIHNFAKIKDANININGITVIAGNNNTGKSTVGKILFSIFNAVYDINRKIEQERKSVLLRIYSKALRKILTSGRYTGNNIVLSMTSTKARHIEMASSDFSFRLRHDEDVEYKNIGTAVELASSIAKKYNLNFDNLNKEKLINEFQEGLKQVSNTDDNKIITQLIETFFNNIFANQFCNLRDGGKAILGLQIHDEKIGITFENKECIEWESNGLHIEHEAFFLDDPFVVDELNSFLPFRYNNDDVRRFVLGKIKKLQRSEINAVNAVIAKEKLNEIEKKINKVVPDTIQNNDDKWGILAAGYQEPLSVENISAGVKAFLILKLLLINGIIQDKDVLILDEPEIHLHPDWQIKYAELIVLLQKKFDLSILVTTHSRDFFEAIELYSQKYGITDKCSYYLSDLINGKVEFKDVTNDTTQIYMHLVNPTRNILDKLRYELEDEDDE